MEVKVPTVLGKDAAVGKKTPKPILRLDHLTRDSRYV